MATYSSLISGRMFHERDEITVLENSVEVYRQPRGPRIKLQKHIIISKDLCWAAGFFMAEGHATYSGIGISNKEDELIFKFRSVIEKAFGVERELWRVYIKTPREDFEEVRLRWREKFEHSKINIYHVPKARDDIVEIRINNVIFSRFFRSFLFRCIGILKKRREWITNFLDGYEVGDGSIIQSENILKRVSITVKESKMKKHIVQMFEILYGIKPNVRKSKGCFEICLGGVHLMGELILDHHFKSSKKKWQKFISCYMKKQYPRSHMRYWRVIMDNTLSIETIAKRSNRSHWSVRDAMALDEKRGLVISHKKHIKDKKAPPFKFYSLSKKGKQLVTIVIQAGIHG